MRLRKDAGLVFGFTIPIKGAGGLIGISLASEKEEARTDKNALAELYALANQFCIRRAALLGNDTLSLPEDNGEHRLSSPELRLVVPPPQQGPL